MARSERTRRGSSRARLSVLLLADDDPRHAETLKDHVAALRYESRHRVRVLDSRGKHDARDLDLEHVDVVVLHWSIVPHLESYLSTPWRAALAAFPGLKVQFIQDEYRWVDLATATMRELGVTLIYSVVPPAEIPKLYGDRVPGADVLTTLTGFVPERLRNVPVPATGSRPLDIAYRGRELPAWTGRLAYEKALIAKAVAGAAAEHGLRVDVDWREDARIYGSAWTQFLTSAKATLGTPSGASIVDYDGTSETAVREYLARHPGAEFEEIHAAVLRDREGNICIDVISPRIFEAAALRTAMILYRGGYSGVLEPERHYLPLERDLSNFDEIAAALRDGRRLEALTARAHTDLVASGRYSIRQFVHEFDEALAERISGRSVLSRAHALVTREKGAKRLPRPRVRPAAALSPYWRQAQRHRREIRALAAGMPRRMISRAKSTATVSAALARFTLADSAYRSIWLRAVRSRSALGDIATDLLRLVLIARRAEVESPFEIDVATRDGALRLQSRLSSKTVNDLSAADAAGMVDGHSLGAIVWDNSLSEPTIVLRVAPGVRLGVHVGLHRFAALEALAVDAPRAVEVVLARALGAETGAMRQLP
ncbi:MAG: hypothetical protein ABI927_01270 [Gaiellaceae bacterium]